MMQLVNVILKTGKTLTGYIINTHGSQIQMLLYEKNVLTFTSFSKSVLKTIEEIRPLTIKEIELLNQYISYSQDIAETEYQIRKLESHKRHINEERETKLKALLKEYLLSEREENIVTLQDIEDDLNEIGFKNLFQLHRQGILQWGENEEISYINEHQKRTPLLYKQKDSFVTLLNQKVLDKNTVPSFLSHELLSEKGKKEDKSSNGERENEKKSHSINFHDIKEELNENGFKMLQELQRSKLLSIEPDGTINFGELSDIPFLSEFLTKKDVFVNFLNQSTPLSIIPLHKGILSFIKDLGNPIDNQTNQFS